MSTPTLRRQFTVHDYARMRETGILTEDDRVELLDGEIYQMSSLGSLHIAIVNWLTKLLMRQIGDDAILSVQNYQINTAFGVKPTRRLCMINRGFTRSSEFNSVLQVL